MARLPSEIRKIAPAFLLALAVTAPFAKVLGSGRTLYGSDFLAYFYPIKRFIFDHFQATGSIPLWNPYLFSGTPIIANIQASMFYPLGFLYYLIPADKAYLYSTILHSILAAVFMYAFVRSLRTSRSGAFLSGFIFASNGYFMAHIYAGHLSFVQNYIWIPLILFFAIKMEIGKLKYVVAGGLVLGVQILGGFPQIAFYTLLAVSLLSLYCGWRESSQRGFHFLGKIAAATLILFAVGFSTAAIQIVPTYEFSRLSTRAGGVDYEFATMDSFPPMNLLTFLFPLVFGSPVEGTYWVSNRPWEFWEYCGYTGIATLTIILIASRKLARNRTGCFFMLLTAAALFLAVGKHNPIYPFIYRLPGFNSFRIPAQILFLYVVSISVLAGMAMDRLNDPGLLSKTAGRVLLELLWLCLPLVLGVYLFPEHIQGLIETHIQRPFVPGAALTHIISIISGSVFSSYCVLFAFSLTWFLKLKGSFPWGIIRGIWIGLVMVDLSAFVSPMVRGVDIRGLLRQGEGLPHVVKDPNSGRTLINGRCFIENAGLWYGFHDVHGYDPLILRRYMEYINQSQGLPPDNKVVNLHYVRDVNNPMIRMLSLRYVIDCDAGAVRTLEDWVPRCRVVHQAEAMKPEAILEALGNRERIDPLKTVLLENQTALATVSGSEGNAPDTGSCRVTRYENDRISLLCETRSPGYLILSEIHYPGWRAYVNGKERPLFTGNYLFRTLFLESGNHEVTLEFRPTSFRVGAAVSLGSLLVAVACLVRCSRRQERLHPGIDHLSRANGHE